MLTFARVRPLSLPFISRSLPLLSSDLKVCGEDTWDFKLDVHDGLEQHFDDFVAILVELGLDLLNLVGHSAYLLFHSLLVPLQLRQTRTRGQKRI